ncbi:MAG: aminopeptidase N [Deltaproteobacteria bacterium]|nr:aminopeptidase N [Deltaproteobacteria bacterium]
MGRLKIKRKPGPYMTQDHALFRSSLISNVHYDLDMSLDEKKPYFSGRVDIHFFLKDGTYPLTVDFDNGKVLRLFVNDEEILKPTYNNFYIEIPSKPLVYRHNIISIQFQRDYSKTGNGLYRFQDPEDQKVYVYSDFEPFEANHMFPCFDQPDLKATYSLYVDAPEEWHVISSTTEKSVTKSSKNKKLWKFPKSEKFSTYIFSLHAGPYKMWKDEAGKIPLRLFARHSMSNYVPVQDWFKLTQQGFEFFQKYFDYPYPFHKYDQIICPDYNMGAMENVAAVTFNEAYLSRGELTYQQRESLAETLLHEMAHMWFGNLVTMKWWDDLWLNESFATYISFLCAGEGTEFKHAWKDFYARIKEWAYLEDQWVTTHPIVTNASDTQQAFANFDGITYGKGASVLKQLAFYLGPTKFRNGLRAYFKKYAFKNTMMRDFISSLAKASGKDLKRWTKKWLKKASLNTIEVKYSTNRKGKISSFELIQSAPQKYRTLRTHKTQIGLYDLKKGSVVLRKALPLTYNKKRTVISALKGQKQPLMIYPNYGDCDFIKIKLDKTTVHNAKNHLSKIEDVQTRMMFWQSLWEMVRDALFSPQEFLDLVLLNLGKEKDIKIATKVSQKISSCYHYLPKKEEERNIYREKIEHFLWENLEKAEDGSDFQKLWLDRFCASAKTLTSQEKLEHLLEGALKLKNYEIDQDRRWGLITQLHKENWKNAEELRKKEELKDPSERGKQSVLGAKASLPLLSNKKKYFERLLNQNSNLKLAEEKVIMEHLFRGEAIEETHLQCADDIFKNIVPLSHNKSNEFMQSYTLNLTPTYGTKETIQKLKTFISKNKKNLLPIVKKILLIKLQEDERTFNIRHIKC